MKTTSKVAIAMALSLAFSLAASVMADPVSDARKAMQAIQAAYNKIDAAANAKNVKGFLAYNAPDYAIVDKSDTVRVQNGPDMESGYTAFFSASLAYSQKTKIDQLSLRGEEAVVTVKQHIDRSATDPKTNQRVRSIINGKLEETWKRTGNGWRRIRTKALEMHATENGKTINAR